MMNDNYEFSEPSWHWKSQDTNERIAYMSMKGRAPLAVLLAHVESITQGAPTDISIAFATVTWTRPANDEELAERAAFRARREERHAAWERRFWDEMVEKYGYDGPPKS